MYTDPGAWSLVVQALIGIVVAIPVIIGIYWRKVKGLFTRGKDAKGK